VPSPPPSRPPAVPGTGGCLSPTAVNYDSTATVDDGSCDYVATGCTSPTAANYNPAAAADDGSCVPHVSGCVLPMALNYDSAATKDDGSCTFLVSGCTDPDALNYYAAAQQDDGGCIVRVLGCMAPVADNYDSTATVHNGSCVYTFAGCTDPTALNFRSDATADDGSCISSVPGCLVPQATNYDPAATLYLAGSCVFDTVGCTEPSALNFNPLATLPNDAACVFAAPGCIFSIATNYDPSANLYDGSCIFAVLGCTDPAAANYYAPATADDPRSPCWYPVRGCASPTALNYNSLAELHLAGACAYAFAGCTDAAAFNYIADATVDDGSCVARVFGCVDPLADNYQPATNTLNSPSVCAYTLRGCTNSTAFNYNALATADDGSCAPSTPGCTAPTAANYEPAANVYDGSCVFDTPGCTDATALNYASTATLDDGSCLLTVSGCMLAAASNFEPSATVDDGSCVLPPVAGCTDSAATNWRPSATADDGSCNYLGCTDAAAVNHDASAQVEDGSCVYTLAGCTDSRAVNYLFLADTDDGSCLFLGCTNPASPSFDSNANADDGSCSPPLGGCTDSSAANYASFAVVSDSAACRYAGCTDPAAKNYNASATFNDGSCVALLLGCTDPAANNYNALAEADDGSCDLTARGCTDSLAANFDPDAVADDGSCLIPGCTDPIGLNYQSTANVNSGCEYQYATGAVLNLGYLTNCTVFLDSDADLLAGATEPHRFSDDNGRYAVPWRERALLGVEPAAIGTKLAVCVDSLTGLRLPVALSSTLEATVITSLTSVATQLVSKSLLAPADASELTCRNLVPCVACADSSQACDSATKCAKACESKGAPLSVFSFDALSAVITIPDKAWFAWLAAQMMTTASVGCARKALVCASRELCGSTCDSLCGPVSNTSAVRVDDAAFAAIAQLTLEGPVDLSDATTLRGVFDAAGAALGAPVRSNVLQIAQECAADNGVVLKKLVVGFESRRRLAEAGNEPGMLAALAPGGSFSRIEVQADVRVLLHRMCESAGGAGCALPRVGCTRRGAANFEPAALLDDGTCAECGCRDRGAANFDAAATCDAPAVCEYAVRGCTVSTALNYDPAATEHDGSCRFARRTGADGRALSEQSPGPLVGCTLPSAANYEPLATQDSGSCVSAIRGCTDAAAIDYNPSTTVFTSCSYAVVGCTDQAALNYLPEATVACTDCCVARVLGCTVRGAPPFEATNFDPSATVNDGSCAFALAACTEPDALNYVSQAVVDDGSCIAMAPGCTDSDATNYDSGANAFDGSCVYQLGGCPDSLAANFDASATLDDETCLRPGCSFATAINYDSAATVHDGSCVWAVAGCSDPAAANYAAGATAGTASCEYVGCMRPDADDYDPSATFSTACDISNRAGCTVAGALNYVAEAEADDGSCRIAGCMDSSNALFSVNATFHYEAACLPAAEAAGCTDPAADNYRPAVATSDAALCIFVGCTDPTSALYSSPATVDGGSCALARQGCTDPDAANFDPGAVSDDGSCILAGCVDSTSANFDSSANAADGSCAFAPIGCTDDAAANFNTGAETDDGSCIIVGCTDSNRTGYDPAATVDSGLCSWSIVGCTLSVAENYSPAATEGGAELCAIRGCPYASALNFDPAATLYFDGACTWALSGCTASAALNFAESATVNDGSCYLPGCTDPAASNFEPAATADNGACLTYRGCTSLYADNFNSAAQVDDNSCIFIGCTSPAANNYDPLANLDGGTCSWTPAGPPPSPPAGSGTSGLIDPLATSDGTALDVVQLDLFGQLDGWLDAASSLGAATAPLGDLDVSGVPDVCVGAPLHDGGAGAVLVALLRADGGIAALRTVGRKEGADSLLELRDDDAFGSAAVRIGDLDGDGVAELAVGAPGDDDNGAEAGAVYVLFLARDGRVRDAHKLNGTSAGMSAPLRPGARFGTALASPGDVDGDGRPDLLVGAPLDSDGCDNCEHGAVYLVLLDERGRARASSKLSPSAWFSGPAVPPGAHIGRALSVTRLPSGVLALAAGVRRSSAFHLASSSGGTTAVSRRRRLSESDSDPGALVLLRLSPSGSYLSHSEVEPPPELANSSDFGAAVAHAPDWNANGVAELVVGAPRAAVGALAAAGAAYVLFLNADGASLASWRRHTAPQPSAGARFGGAVAVLGKVNADMVADIVIGAPGDGAAFLVLMTPLVAQSAATGGSPWLAALLGALAPFLLIVLLVALGLFYRRQLAQRDPQPLLVSLVAREAVSSATLPLELERAAPISGDEVRLSFGSTQPVSLESVGLLSTGTPADQAWPPPIAVPNDDASEVRLSNGQDVTWGSGASSPDSWGTSTLGIIDRQDDAEGGDLVDSGLEVTYRVNYPRADA